MPDSINPFDHLCYNDPRSTMFAETWDDDEDAPTPRNGCHCDNCHRGKDELALEIIRLRGLVAVPKPKADYKQAAEFIRQQWNSIAGAAGFAKIRVMSSSRISQIKATMKDHGSDGTVWMGAIQRYVTDAKRWPERRAFGFDSFIRAKNRDKWFEEVGHQIKPHQMDADEADRHYTEGFR